MSNDPKEKVSLETSFVRVDDQPDPSLMVETMDQTSRWPAIIALRAFEADHLDLAPGDRVLDVGCGRGEVACAMAARVGPGGGVVGVDASEAMLANARARADATGVEVDFRVGDCLALEDVDASYDAARAERMLQWIDDPDAAVAEIVRVLRPGGRLGLIDTDWRTLAIDLPDREVAVAVGQAMVATRGWPAAMGGQLVNLCRRVGLVDVEVRPATHVWTGWDPEVEHSPSGFFPLDEVTPQFVTSGVLTAEQCETFLAQTREAGREGRFFMSLTMFAVVARKP